MREIRYRSKNLRETLVDLKDTSELAVDLAYSAVLFDNADLAAEVINLEAHASYLQYHARIALMLASKTVSDAEALVGIFQVADGAVTITEAAADMARITANGFELPAAFRRLPAAHEQFARLQMDATSELTGEPLGAMDLDIDEGVTILAIRRDDEWVLDPAGTERLHADDILFARGPEEGIAAFYEDATGKPFEPVGAAPADAVIEEAVATVVELKNVSELAVGLAYSAALYDSDVLADAVRDLEAQSNALRQSLEEWVVSSDDRRIADPEGLQAVIHLVVAAEVISDAALDIAEVVFRDVELHPVFAQAIKDSKTVITNVQVGPESDLIGRTITAFEHDLEAATTALALHRDGEWVFDPAEATELAAGDMLVLAGSRRGIDRIRAMASD